MEFKQVNIFGEQILIVNKNNKSVKFKTKNKNKVLENKIKILYKMYEELYEKQNINLLDNREIIIKKNIIYYLEERQAEPIDIINLSINDIDKRILRMKEILNAR